MKRQFILLMLFFGLSLFLNTYHLDTFPPTTHCDELFGANVGKQIATGEIKNIISTAWWDVPTPAFLLQAVSYLMYGNTILAARIPAAIIGALTLIPIFFMVSLLFNHRIAYTSIFLLLTSHWWLAISRLGNVNIISILFEILTFYSVILGFNKKKSIYFLISGVFIGLGSAYLYLNFKIVPLIVILMFAHAIIKARKSRDLGITYLKYFLIMIFSAVITSSPMIYHYFNNPQTILSKTSSAYIFSSTPSTIEHMFSLYKTDNRLIWLFKNIVKSLNVNDGSGDMSLLYGYKGKILDIFSLTLLIIGQIIAFLKIKKIKYFLLLIWFWSTFIILTMLTVDPITYHRIVGILPAVYIFIGVALFEMMHFIDRIFKNNSLGRIISHCTIIFLIFIISAINLKIYFYDNSKKGIWIFTKKSEMYISEYMNKIKKKYKYFFLTDLSINPNFCIFWYSFPSFSFATIKAVDSIPDLKGPKLFIISNSFESRISEIRLKYPQGTLHKIEDGTGSIYKTDL